MTKLHTAKTRTEKCVKVGTYYRYYLLILHSRFSLIRESSWFLKTDAVAFFVFKCRYVSCFNVVTVGHEEPFARFEKTKW